MRRSILAVALLVAGLAACTRDLPTGAAPEIAPAVLPPGAVLEIVPNMVALTVGQTQQFDAFIMVPDFPPLPVDVSWSLTTADIGVISTTFGPSTVLTAALPADVSAATGQLEAFTLDGLFAETDVEVAEGEPIGQGQKQVCVKLSKDGKPVGQEYCGRVMIFEIGFTPGKDFKAVYAGGETSADPKYDALVIQVNLTSCTIVKAQWKKGTANGAVIAGAAGATELTLTVPLVNGKPTTDGEITLVKQGSKDVVYTGGKEPRNDARLYFK